MGCRCPVVDNSYGKGYMGQSGIFVFNESCPIHAKEIAECQKQFESTQQII